MDEKMISEGCREQNTLYFMQHNEKAYFYI